MNSDTLNACLQLARAHALILRRLDAGLANLHGLSFSDYQMLHHLGRAPGQRLRRIDLAEKMALTASAVTRALLALERIGLVERQDDPRDARVSYAVLSPAGQGLLADADLSARQIAAELMQPEHAEQLSQLLQALSSQAALS